MNLPENPVICDTPVPLQGGRGLALLANYLVGYIFVYPFILAIVAVLFSGTTTLPLPYMYFLHGAVLVLTLKLAWPLLKESAAIFRQNEIASLLLPLKLFPWMYLASIGLSVAASAIGHTASSSNEQTLLGMMNHNLPFLLFLSLIFSPIVEEIIFRGVLYRCLRKRGRLLLPLLVSSLTFGFLHVATAVISGHLMDLVYLPLYMVLGIFLALAYEKSGNLYSAMLLHFLNNSISVFFSLLAIFFLH